MSRGVSPTRIVVACFGVSLVIHGGVGVAVGTLPLEMFGTGQAGRMRGTSGGLGGSNETTIGTLAYLEPEEQPRVQAEDDPALAALLAELKKQQEEQAKAEEKEPTIRLGIAESPHKTENWIGFREPTPHAAMKGSTDQPELSLKPGTPGDPMAGQVGMPGEMTPVIPPEIEAITGIPTTQPPSAIERAAESPMAESQPETRAPSEMVAGVPQSMQPKADGTDAMAREGEKDATANEAVKSAKGVAEGMLTSENGAFVGPPLPEWMTPDGAMIAQAPRGHEQGTADGVQEHRMPTRAKVMTPSPAAVPEVRASTPPGATMPAYAAQPANAAVRGTPGDGGSSPGIQSERESDASSMVESLEVRPGRPAAAEGLEVLTRRIDLSLLSRSARMYSYPLLEVKFDRRGRVAHIEVLESSGSSDVDDSTVNSVYKWSARGRQLEELPNTPNAGITINLRIILR